MLGVDASYALGRGDADAFQEQFEDGRCARLTPVSVGALAGVLCASSGHHNSKVLSTIRLRYQL
jgi:hypothetical protein